MDKKPSCFTAKINLSLEKKLRKDLEEQGFSFTKPPHTLFSAKKQGITCVLYESGSLVVQGKDKDPFIEFYLEPEVLQDFSYTNPLTKIDLTSHIGVDEAGKGDFFGPLCIVGLYADSKGIEELVSMGVKDSKLFSDAKIKTLGKQLKDKFATSIIRLYPIKYNELYDRFKNLNRLLAWGHATAIADLFTKTKCNQALIDQFAPKAVVEQALAHKKIPMHLKQMPKAEQDPVVAAASIIARLSFLEGLEALSEEFSIPFPKGANHGIMTIGKKFISLYGKDALVKVAKLHFKTTKQIIQQIENP